MDGLGSRRRCGGDMARRYSTGYEGSTNDVRTIDCGCKHGVESVLVRKDMMEVMAVMAVWI